MMRDRAIKGWTVKGCLMATCLCVLADSSALAQEIEATPRLSNPIGLFSSKADANKLQLKTTRTDGDANNSVIYPALYATYLDDSVTEQTHTSGLTENVIAEIVPDPHAVVDPIPPTITVRTEVLLELHSMRNNAVHLCLQIPKKYRTRLPECADIFSHEIRLQALARDKTRDKK
jgi:hypothetical protein